MRQWQCRAPGEWEEGSSFVFQHKTCSYMTVTAISREDMEGMWLSPQRDHSSGGNVGKPDSLHPRQRSCGNYYFK